MARKLGYNSTVFILKTKPIGPLCGEGITRKKVVQER